MTAEPSLLETMKYYAPIFLAFILGIAAHIIESIQKNGWKGWFNFTADVILCLFSGWVFYHTANIYAPSLVVISTSLGSYWGTKGLIYLKTAAVNSANSIKSNLPKE